MKISESDFANLFEIQKVKTNKKLRFVYDL